MSRTSLTISAACYDAVMARQSTTASGPGTGVVDANGSPAPDDHIRWESSALVLLDQRHLPARETFVTCRDAADVCAAIAEMVVRGAPAIGVAAAYGVVLSVRGHHAAGGGWRARVAADVEALRASRPTAVNLAWALDQLAASLEGDDAGAPERVLARARALHEGDVAANRALGDHGAATIARGGSPVGVLTHCNAGALATAGYGTALGVIRSLARAGALREVFVTETRPWLQGARLTAWELERDGLAPTLIADGAAGWLMREGRVQWVVTGADRIAANGDTANKIGTYGLATLARAHGAGFMIAAPLSTIDRDAATGADIPIEHRDSTELTHVAGTPVAAHGVAALNPVFDVTPVELIDALATERGVLEPPGGAAIASLFGA